MPNTFSYRIFPLGDSALTLELGNELNEKINQQVIARFRQLQEEPIPYMIEAVPAYSTLTIYYDMIAVRKIADPGITSYEWMKEQVLKKLEQPVKVNTMNSDTIRIPVCYEGEFAPDMQVLAGFKNCTPEEVIQLHVSRTYRVYMLGFLPGFAYMGEVDEKITMPRRAKPGMVKPGSIGIAGKQTGIYPLPSPGGWHIIGRTPLKLFDAHKEQPTLLKAGDYVQFFSIGKNEFANY
jgi:inhibitor of KinA